MTAHAKYAPSGMYPTVNCHGRRTMIHGIEEEETESSKEGTAAHWVGECLFFGRPVGVDDLTPNGVIVTDEMIEAAHQYVDVVRSVTTNASIETRVSMPQIHTDCWGTPDAFWYDEALDVVHVWDFKYGHGSVVAFENYQLMAYALGVLNALGKPFLLATKIVLNIVQPRCYDGNGLVRTWNTTFGGIRDYIGEMATACAASDSNTAPVSSGRHCTYCPGRHVCPAAREAAAKAFEYIMSPLPQIVSNNALGYELEILELAEEAVKNRKEALEIDALSRMRSGKPIPGFDVVQGYSRDKWLKPKEEVVALGSLMGVDLTKTDVITPTQAKTLLKKNAIDGSVIKPYHGKQPTSMKLVRDDGSRAKLIFNQE